MSSESTGNVLRDTYEREGSGGLWELVQRASVSPKPRCCFQVIP